MRYIIALLLTLSVIGCGSNPVKPEPQIVVKQQYIIKIPPAEVLRIPAPVPDTDPDTAKQSDIARWMAATVKRMDDLESELIGVSKFFDEEQKKLDATK
jgi:hypothetical protein